MLRSLFACFTVSALAMTAGCHKAGDSNDSSSGDPAPSAAAENTGKKTTQSSGTPGTSGTTTGDPGSSSATPPAGPPPIAVSDQITVSEVKITVNGEARRYLLGVPKNYDENKAYPLIIGLHGDGQNADDFIASSKVTLASGDQAIVAFPDQVLDLFTAYTNNNDQRLVAATISQVKKTRNIDAGKIWGFGYSKGAFMLNEMGCRKPGLFTAIAPHSGGAPQEQTADGEVNCPNAQALAVFASMGANDDPEGGKFEADYWSGLAGCHGGMQAGTPDVCQAYKGCDSPVVYCQIPNHAHFPLWDDAASASWAWFNSL